METSSIDAYTREDIPENDKSHLELPWLQRDREADQIILDILSSTEFTNKVVVYNYQYRPWELRIVFNPEKHRLILKEISEDSFMHFSYALVAKEELPEELKNHLIHLIKQRLGGSFGELDSHLCLTSACKTDFEMFDQLAPFNSSNLGSVSIRPVQIPLPTSDSQNPEMRSPVFRKPDYLSIPRDDYNTLIDKEIQEVFTSKTFTSKIIEYPYLGKTYSLIFINNPEARLLGSETSSIAVQNSLIVSVSAPLPSSFAKHIESLIPKTYRGLKNSVVALDKPCQHGFEDLVSLHPVTDDQIDAQIQEVFTSKTFTSKVIEYPYLGKPYSLIFINNPETRLLGSETSSIAVQNSLIVSALAPLPTSFAKHIESLIPKTHQGSKNSVIALDKPCQYGSEYLTSIQPLRVNRDGGHNFIFDQEIQQLFSSLELKNQEFYYQINEKYYRVRIIHNPENTILTATYPVHKDSHTIDVEIQWPYRYSIIIDRSAPKSLVNHISKLAAPSLWDSFFSFQVCNGTAVYANVKGQSTNTGISYYDWLALAKKAD